MIIKIKRNLHFNITKKNKIKFEMKILKMRKRAKFFPKSDNKIKQ